MPVNCKQNWQTVWPSIHLYKTNPRLWLLLWCAICVSWFCFIYYTFIHPVIFQLWHRHCQLATGHVKSILCTVCVLNLVCVWSLLNWFCGCNLWRFYDQSNCFVPFFLEARKSNVPDKNVNYFEGTSFQFACPQLVHYFVLGLKFLF